MCRQGKGSGQGAVPDGSGAHGGADPSWGRLFSPDDGSGARGGADPSRGHKQGDVGNAGGDLDSARGDRHGRRSGTCLGGNAETAAMIADGSAPGRHPRRP